MNFSEVVNVRIAKVAEYSDMYAYLPVIHNMED